MRYSEQNDHSALTVLYHTYLYFLFSSLRLYCDCRDDKNVFIQLNLRSIKEYQKKLGTFLLTPEKFDNTISKEYRFDFQSFDSIDRLYIFTFNSSQRTYGQ